MNAIKQTICIYRWHQAQYDDETLNHGKTFKWCKGFKEGRMSVDGDPGQDGSEPTTVIPHVTVSG